MKFVSVFFTVKSVPQGHSMDRWKHQGDVTDDAVEQRGFIYMCIPWYLPVLQAVSLKVVIH